MKRIPQTVKVNVEAMMRRIYLQKPTKLIFEMPCNTEQTYDMLKAAYMAEVKSVGREMVTDDETANNLLMVAKALCEGKKQGIFLCGNMGNGKTTTLKAFQDVLNYLREYDYLDAGEMSSIRIVDAKDVARLTEAKAWNRLRNEPMLGIEDMGREATEKLDYGNVTSPIVDLLEYRYQERLFTFVTTNLTPDKIAEKYGARIADRFKEQYTRIVFKQKSYRI